jgi:hypothetical protein
MLSAHAKLLDRMEKLQAAYAVLKKPPEGLWLTWDDAQAILAFMAGVPTTTICDQCQRVQMLMPAPGARTGIVPVQAGGGGIALAVVEQDPHAHLRGCGVAANGYHAPADGGGHCALCGTIGPWHATGGNT